MKKAKKEAKKEAVKRLRCTCGYPGRNHSRPYCKPTCRYCNELAAADDIVQNCNPDRAAEEEERR